MTPDFLDARFVYPAILVAAAVEGEVAYVAACALVAHGRLNAASVILAGATGAAVGDQFYFYLLRRHLMRWVARFPSLQRRAEPLVALVRRHDHAMVLLIRFAPGLRIAIAAACAYANLRPLTFTLLNALAAVVWATALMILVGWFGPTFLSRFGLSGWKGALIVGAAVIVIFRIAGYVERRALPVRTDELD
ncbi:MAG TPA: VTT domain-containing protein [Gemmatimonadaceae bacterium]|nr:VTT domain-containing protein [Gemmatimonadaceae bacterium]